MQPGNRLEKIAACVPKCDVLADIGTDHGYIPIRCVKNDVCKRAVACDINEGPLKAAERNICANELEEAISVRLSNGLEKLAPNEADVIVIAGMGGFLIRDIIKAGKEKIGNALLVLQPMVAAPELREFLRDEGFCVCKEELAREGNKFYNIICAEKGSASLSEKDILLGKGIENDESYGDYVVFRKGVIEKIIFGLEKSTEKEQEISKYKKMLEIISK